MALPTSKKTWSEGMSTEKEITMILWKVWVLLRAWDNPSFHSIEEIF